MIIWVGFQIHFPSPSYAHADLWFFQTDMAGIQGRLNGTFLQAPAGLFLLDDNKYHESQGEVIINSKGQSK